MELVDARGPAWTLVEGMNGGLDPLLAERASANGTGDGELLAWLQQRSDTLDRIEAGGWWRLRSRLRPALRMVERVRGR